MSEVPPEIPVPVLADPYWRVTFRPSEYVDDRIPSLKRCVELIQKNRVAFRGWDYPMLSSEQSEREYGNNWLASWSDFMGNREYWRLYQSGQFLHLFSIREVTESRWREKLLMHAHLPRGQDANDIPGFLSLGNTIYCVAEIIEFAARLCQSGVYDRDLQVSISLNDVEGFLLVSDHWGRIRTSSFSSSPTIGRKWEYKAEDLIGRNTHTTIDILVWLFERFGWLNPSIEMLRKEIEDFKSGRS